ncbi:hypothetical protein A4A49_24229 [Nicotiana attenuata]|uniref:Secreted protein n=1 Tax=Nicotiana attenuata TaxID=49451 RepID=A0A314KSR8_NICAT|nr:hypothetical protein A4A49_24229 [Nicotiana attenuata]
MRMIITCIFALFVIQEVAIFENSFTEKASLGIIGIWPLLAVSARGMPSPPTPRAATTIGTNGLHPPISTRSTSQQMTREGENMENN